MTKWQKLDNINLRTNSQKPGVGLPQAKRKVWYVSMLTTIEAYLIKMTLSVSCVTTVRVSRRRDEIVKNKKTVCRSTGGEIGVGNNRRKNMKLGNNCCPRTSLGCVSETTLNLNRKDCSKSIQIFWVRRSPTPTPIRARSQSCVFHGPTGSRLRAPTVAPRDA